MKLNALLVIRGETESPAEAEAVKSLYNTSVSSMERKAKTNKSSENIANMYRYLHNDEEGLRIMSEQSIASQS